MKRMIKTILDFLSCNLAAFCVGIFCEVAILTTFSLFVESTFASGFLRAFCMTASLPLCLYFICFHHRRKGRFADFYVTHIAQFGSSSGAAARYFRKNAIFLVPVLFVSTAVLTVLPKHWATASAEVANSLDLYNDIADMLLSSSSLFVEYVPDLFFEENTAPLRLVGSVLWSVYYLLAYWAAMNFALKKWNKFGMECTRTWNVRKLLTVGGIVFQTAFWLYLLAVFFVGRSQSSGDNSSAWFQMLYGLFLALVFETLYFADAVWAVVQDRTHFNITKMGVVVISAFLMMGLMGNGPAETTICNVFLVVLLIVECVSLSKDKKYFKQAGASGAK